MLFSVSELSGNLLKGSTKSHDMGIPLLKHKEIFFNMIFICAVSYDFMFLTMVCWQMTLIMHEWEAIVFFSLMKVYLEIV